MIFRLLIILLLLFQFPALHAQKGHPLLDSAAGSFCHGDTLTTISYLEAFLKQYVPVSKEGNARGIIGLRLGEFYLGRNELEIARDKLLEAFPYSTRKRELYYYRDSCGLFKLFRRMYTTAYICEALYNVYMELNEPANAIQYLQLADGRYMPTFDWCVNGMNNYKAYLSLKFADFYCKAGDTTRAINRLLDYAFCGEYYSIEATLLLKKLLYTRYTPHQVRKEIRRGIANFKKVYSIGDDGKIRYRYEWWIFNNRPGFYFSERSLRLNKRIIRKNYFLNLLMK